MNSKYQEFYQYLWNYYHASGRHDLPWRQATSDGTLNPYHILVSEIMLQQTQVTRVIPKYQEFLAAFPTIQSLAQAEIGDVIRAHVEDRSAADLYYACGRGLAIIAGQSF